MKQWVNLNFLPTLLAQVGSQGSDQGNGRNQSSDAVNDNIQGDVRNVIVNNDRRGCTYKEFLACNPKEYDGKGGVIVYTRWIKKIESVQDMSGYGITKRSTHEIHGMVAVMEPATIRKAIQKAGTLTDEAIRNGSLMKNTEKRGNGGESNRHRNVKDDNKRSRTGNAFTTTTNPMKRVYTGMAAKYTNCNSHHSPKSPCRACFSYNRLGHLAKDYRVVPRMEKPVNARNPTAAREACFEYGGRGNNGNRAHGGAFMLGAEEAR
ncbi:hypothetical protein Tco_0904598 [Tanacetum coccineum]